MSDTPFSNFLEDLREEILTDVEEVLATREAQSGLLTQTKLDPYQLYTAGEAADLLGVERETMYRIPETELPKRKVGPSRGALRWFGLDLLTYMHGMDPIESESIIRKLREAESS